ncbi:MAG: TAXI family TRAP transporter solute-binding subunit [Deltaproteobacteria bacterium]|nr:TAXI family TRAP transporter solute-binding subunit [Deltaproteobacteria bacterium]
MEKKGVFVGVLVCVLLSAFLSSEAFASEIKLLKIGTASPGGNWYLSGAALAPKLEEVLPGVRVTSTTGGSVSNTVKVNSGRELQIGLTIANVQYQAYKGMPPFFKKAHENIRFIGTIETMIWQMVVPRKSNIFSVYDLKDKRINPGKIGWGDRVIAELVLKAHGLSFKIIEANGGVVNSLGFNDAATMMQDGHLDCEMTYGAIMPFLLNLDTRPGLRWLPFGGKERDTFLSNELAVGWAKATLKKGAYAGVTEDIPAVGVQTTVIVNKDLPDDMVYKITEVLFESGFQKDIFAAAERKGFPKTCCLETVMNGATIPIHPGALRYFKEKGVPIRK